MVMTDGGMGQYGYRQQSITEWMRAWPWLDGRPCIWPGNAVTIDISGTS